MRTEFAIPEVDDFSAKLADYQLNTLLGNSISANREINALVFAYLRLVDEAIVEYQLGRQQIGKYYSTSNALHLRAVLRSVANFEHCISAAHRAIRCFRRLRGHSFLGHLEEALRQPKRSFATDAIAKPISDLRNAIQHLESSIMKGELPEGSPIALKVEGPEIPDSTEPSQTIKRLDSLVLGNLVLPFSELAACLSELGEAAVQLIDAWRPAHELQALGYWSEGTPGGVTEKMDDKT